MSNPVRPQASITTALMIVDVSGEFSKENPEVTHAVNDYVDQVHASHLDTLVIRIRPVGDYRWTGPYPVPVHPNANGHTNIAVKPNSDPFNRAIVGEYALGKTEQSAFDGTALETLLKGFDRLERCRILGNNFSECVKDTALDAVALMDRIKGRKFFSTVEVLTDLCGDRPGRMLGSYAARQMQEAGVILTTSGIAVPVKQSAHRKYNLLANALAPNGSVAQELSRLEQGRSDTGAMDAHAQQERLAYLGSTGALPDAPRSRVGGPDMQVSNAQMAALRRRLGLG